MTIAPYAWSVIDFGMSLLRSYGRTCSTLQDYLVLILETVSVQIIVNYALVGKISIPLWRTDELMY